MVNLPSAIAQESSLPQHSIGNYQDPILQWLRWFEYAIRILTAITIGFAVSYYLDYVPPVFRTWPAIVPWGLLGAVMLLNIGAWSLFLVDGIGWTVWFRSLRNIRRRLRPFHIDERTRLRHGFMAGGFEGAPPWLHGYFAVMLTDERFILRIPGTIPQLCILEIPREALLRIDVVCEGRTGRKGLHISWRSDSGRKRSLRLHPHADLRAWVIAFAEWGIPVGLPAD